MLDMKCEDCDGDGSLYIDVTCPNGDGFFEYKACDNCNGTGEIEEEEDYD